MSLLAGSLFGIAEGAALVIFTATAGASSCYFLSKLIGRPLAMWLWPDKLRFFTREVGLGVSIPNRCRPYASICLFVCLFVFGWLAGM